MYFTQLPDHSAPGFDEATHFSKFRKHNIVFNAESSNSYCDEHMGCLSIKTISKGTEWYGIDHHRLAVRPGHYLVLNNDQQYSCQIAREEKAHCLSVFFRNNFAAAVFHDMQQKEDHLPEHPSHNHIIPEFYQTLQPLSPVLFCRLQFLISDLENDTNNEGITDEHLVFLLRHLLFTHRSDLKRQSSIPSIKVSTRHELYKRLCIARDILHSSFSDPLDLNQISQYSLLSVPQLVRQFRSVFHCTPYQYLIRLRMENAATLLTTTDQSVQGIAWTCGFANPSAFGRAFKSAYKCTPQI
ncbi:MAG: helix-turn-helix transcriptional regulator [Chitinophagaceae bacterium]|nr:helix-turn-helix transcriptional regulator [Chitinophagaceae bacterium]